MKKILLFLVALVATLSMNAQTTEIHNETGKVASYLGADVTVKFGVAGDGKPTLEVYKGGELQKTYTGSEYKVVSTPVEGTFKAVYNTDGAANTLTFYYDADDHSGKGIIVFDNLPTAATKDDDWGYNSIRKQVFEVVIDESVKNYSSLTSTAYMFYEMYNADKITGAEHLDVTNVTDMSHMFEAYGYNKEVNMVPNVSGWNTSKVTSMKCMFIDYGYKSENLTAIPDVSGWKTDKVTDLEQMFEYYGHNSTALNTVPNVSNWNTGNVTNMTNMFYGYGHTSTNISCVLDLSGWDLSKIEEDKGGDVFHFKPKTFNVKIPHKTGEKSNEGGKWYYGNGTKYITPPTSKTFTPTIAGPLKGEFSVSATKKVRFSQGNLTYNVTDTKWAFYEHQYDCATGYDATLISLFTWGYDAVNSIVPNGTNFVEGHPGETFSKAEDWGYVFGGESSVWRTLTKAEWVYLFNTRTMTNSKARYSNAVDGVTIGSTTYKGVFLYPDDYNGEVVSSSMTWDAINAAGIVFLPATGVRRDGSTVSNVGTSGCYWSSTAGSKNYAFFVTFLDGNVDPGASTRCANGSSVRLVTDASVTPAPTPTTTGTAKRTGDIDVKWIQLWENGPKFAEYNIGATSATDYGEYYAWGGSQNKVDDHNTGSSALSGDSDTATNLWGGNWRMPTADELGKKDDNGAYVDGLLGKCTVEWIDGTTKKYKDTDITGLLCTGKGDYASNSVFLPAAGFCVSGDVYDQGNFGYYRSSTPNGSNGAYYLRFRSGFQGVYGDDYRDGGYSVRAVLAE